MDFGEIWIFDENFKILRFVKKSTTSEKIIFVEYEIIQCQKNIFKNLSTNNNLLFVAVLTKQQVLIGSTLGKSSDVRE